MSFADPSALAGWFATAVTFTGAVPAQMARQSEGRYISTNAGTADEPLLWTLGSVYRPGGVSTFTSKLALHKNVAPINGVPQSDDILLISTQIKFPHRSFTTANLTSIACANLGIYADGVQVAKILRGER